MKAINRYASYATVNNILKTEGYVPLAHSNYVINGIKQGFSGFWKNPHTDNILYVSTGLLSHSLGTVLLRSADSIHDYVGGHNMYCSNAEDLLSIAAKVTR